MAIMPRTLSNLPVEILHLVFELLPTRSLLLSQLICKHFRRIIRESSHLQYTLSLSKSRLVESPLADLLGLSYSDLLAIHRQHEKAWRTFDFSCRHDLHLPRGNVYDLKSSLYAHGIESDNGTTSSVTFYDLPHAPYARGSQNNTTTEHVTDTPPRLRSWTHPITDLTLRDFTVDPSQDLLVFVAVTPQSPACYEVHFRTLSGNVAHPLAMSPSIPCLPRAFANPFGPVMGGPALPGMANVGQALQNVFQAMHPLQGLLNTVNQLLAAAGGQVLPVPGGPPAPPPAAPPPGIPALPQGPLAMPQPVQPNPQPLPQQPFPAPPPNLNAALQTVLNNVNGLAGVGPGGFPPMGAARVQLLDDLVALMVQLPVQGTHLVIWNWKKGEIFTGCVLSLNSGMDDFTLISSNSFIVITPTGKFELYQFDLIPSDTPPHSTMALGPIPYFNTESAPSPPHLEMWKICYPTLIARYHLPALNPGHAFSSLSLSSNPVMSHPPPRGSTEYLSAEDITWDGTPLQSQSQASQDDPGSFILSESQCSGLDFEESSPDTLPQRPLPLDFRLTHPSACSRVFACGLFVVKSRAMNITLGVMPGQPAAQPGQLQAQLFAHIVPAAPGAQFPLLGGPVPPQVFHGPPPAFGPPPPPLPFPLQPNGPPPPVHQHPAPAAPAHQPQQQQQPPAHGPNVVGGNPPPPHPGMLFGDGPADDGLPLLHSFVFFANLGHFLHDLEQLERQRVPLPTPPPPVDAEYFSVMRPFDVMFKLPLTPATPVNEEQEQIIKAHERVVQQFRSRCVASNAPQFSWGAWGPNRTRWFNEFHSQDWQHAVFGTRAVETALRVNGKLMTGPRKSRKTVDEMIQEMLDKEEEEAGKPVERRVGKALVLRDFNPYSCSNPEFYLDGHGGKVKEKEKKEGGKSWGKLEVVTEPSTVDGCGAFRDEVTSSLPYTQLVSNQDFDLSAAMIDEDHLLLFKREGQVGGAINAIDILTF